MRTKVGHGAVKRLISSYCYCWICAGYVPDMGYGSSSQYWRTVLSVTSRLQGGARHQHSTREQSSTGGGARKEMNDDLFFA
jgi:hypothetical protein